MYSIMGDRLRRLGSWLERKLLGIDPNAQPTLRPYFNKIYDTSRNAYNAARNSAKAEVSNPNPISRLSCNRRTFSKVSLVAIVLGILNIKCSKDTNDNNYVPTTPEPEPVADIDKKIPLYTGLGACFGILTETEWNALRAGSLNGAAYTQTLNFFDSTQVLFGQNNQYDTTNFLHGLSTVTDANANPIFEWQAQFAGGMTAASDLSDIVDQDMNIAGRDYRIVYASRAGTNVALEMIAYDVAATMTEKDKEERTITVNDLPRNVKMHVISQTLGGDYLVSFTVDNQVIQLKKGELGYLSDGTPVSVLNIMPNAQDTAADSAEIAFGARKLRMQDVDMTDPDAESNVFINNAYAPNAQARVQGQTLTDGRVQINSIGYRVFAQGSTQDDLYVPEGQKLSDKQNAPKELLVDAKFNGLETMVGSEMPIELVHVGSATGRGYELTFTNNQGVRYSTPFVYHDTATNLQFAATDGSKVILSELESGGAGSYFILTGQNDETRAYRLTGINKTTKTLTFQDLGTGSTVLELYNPTSGTCGLKFGGNFAAIHVDEINDTIKVDVDCDGTILQAATKIHTVYGGVIDASNFEFTALGDLNMSLVTPKENFTSTEIQNEAIYFRIKNGVNGTTDIMHIPVSEGGVFANNGISAMYNDPLDNMDKGMSKFGVKAELTSLTNGNNLKLYYPPEQRFANITVMRSRN